MTHKCKRCAEPAEFDGFCRKHRSRAKYIPRAKPGRKRNRTIRPHPTQTESRWRALASAYRKENPFCVSCAILGKTVKANHVDHIFPARLFPDRLLDTNNLQSLCMSCHSRKTVYEKRGIYRMTGHT